MVVATQIRLSMERLRDQDAEAAAVMNACALLAPELFTLPPAPGRRTARRRRSTGW